MCFPRLLSTVAAMSVASALWVGRVREGGRVHSVRVRTAGAPPGPEDVCEAIDDPFVDEGGDPWALADGAPARADGPSGPLGGLGLAAPLRPSKVIGVGRNFRAHAAELGNEVPTEPLLFFKPPSCVIPSGQAIVLPRGFERIDLEGELVVVIGRRAKDVDAARALEHVAGYALGNDVSCRDLQRRDKQWTRAKGFDTFGPIGAFVRMTPPGFAPPLAETRLRSLLRDEPCQDASLADMIFSIPALIATISACMTLLPGDLIYTGTPEGVRPLVPGDVVQIHAVGPFSLAPVVNPVV